MTDRNLIYFAARGLPPGNRAAYLITACGGDHELRARLEQMLAVADEAEAFITDVPDDGSEDRTSDNGSAKNLKLDLADAPDEAVGQTLGRYKLLERVGEGGCGVVYVVEQTEPVRRRVALKVIKLGMDTKQVVARFEAERQALAMMDHPNIAKVLDAGTIGAPDSQLSALNSQLPLGRPYFVMELVRGIRITDYCDQANLTTKERLDLFIKVCHAIQHAHQKGIIHRDIKPSNILVTSHDGVPVPKVIDFGIAKATEGRLTDATVYTQLHQFIGTPAYMSPEQAQMSGLDIDTRSDIYSLGVLLYELLAGSTPFDAKELLSKGLDEMRRTIREVEPIKPSTRLTQERSVRSGSSKSEIGNPKSEIEQDLDWIVMKCLEKDRQRRYDTANGLAADIKRHLDNEPVVARPPSRGYRFQKAWRRNKLAFTAAAAVAIALVAGIGVSTWQTIRATRAEREQSKLREVAVNALDGEKEQRVKAETEQQRADSQARKAVENQEHSRRLLYAADMNLAYQAVNKNNLGRARRLLERHRAAPGEEDLRGWEWRYLWQQCRSDALAQLTKRSEEGGFSVSFSPDGAQLAVGYWKGRIELWDVTRRVLLKELNQAGPAAHVAFSPRSNLLAATAGKGTLKLHDLSSGRETILWNGTNSSFRELSFTPDASRLVAFRYERTGSAFVPSAMLFDVVQGIALSTNTTSGTNSGNTFVGCARLSSDKKRLFLSHRDERTRQVSVKCLDAETSRALWTADSGKDFGMSAMALSPDDKFLVTSTGFADATIRVWDAETGKLFTRLEGHTGWVVEMTFSRDGRWLASAAADHTIRLWKTSGWTEARVFRGHGDEVHTVAFNPDGRMLASSGKDGAVLLWDIADRQSAYGYHLLPHDVISLAEYAPGLAHALEGNRQKYKSFLLRLEDQSQTRFTNGSINPGVVLPPNLFAQYEQTNVLRVLEYREVESELFREVVGTNLVREPGSAGSAPRAALAHSREHRLIAWSEKSGKVHIASLDQSARRWQWSSELERPRPRAFSPDGKLLVLDEAKYKTQGRSLEVREVTSGKLVLSSEMTLPLDYDVLFADAGRKLVIGNGGIRTLFWELSRAEQAPKRLEERASLVGLRVSPDGRWVAVGHSGIAVLYDAVSMERKKVLDGTMQSIHSLTFSPDSRILATGAGGLEAVKLWQVETGQELLTLPGNGGLLRNIAFAEDGNTLLLGDGGTTDSWQMWRAPSWEVIHSAEAKEKTENKQP